MEMESEKPRVVIDTVGFVRSLIRPNGAWGAVLTEFAASYRLVLSPELATEIRSVFARSKVIRRLAVSAPAAIEFLDRRFESAVWIYLGSVPQICRDPDDDMVIATAIAGDAQFLITADDDLLSLGVAQDVRVVTAERFLSIIRSSRM